MKRIKLEDRELPIYTKGEEIFNMTSHIVGGVLGVVAIVLCVIFAAIHGNVYGVISGSIYGLTMLLLKVAFSVGGANATTHRAEVRHGVAQFVGDHAVSTFFAFTFHQILG